MAEDLVGQYLLGVGSSKPGNTDLVSQFLLSPQTNLPGQSNDDFDVTGAPRVPVSDDPVINRQSNIAKKERELNPPAEATKLQKAGELALALPIEWIKNTSEKYHEGISSVTGGINDIQQNLPASGVGKVGLGLMGAVASPITGGIKTLVEDPVTKLTGNSTIGEKAGLLAGTSLPVKLGSSAISKVLPKNQARTNIVDAIGIENLPEIIARMKENPRISLADASPAVRQMSQKLITTEGSHQNKFEKFINERVGTAKGSVENIYNDTMGVPVNIVEKLKELKQAAKDVGKREINPAVGNSKPVDISGVIKSIDDKLKPGINSVVTAGQPLPLGDIEKPLANLKKFLIDGKSVRTDADDLNRFQSALRSKADDLMNSTDGQSRQLGYALMDVRNQIVDAIDVASQGKYKPALAKYRDEMQIQDAFQKGQLVTRNRLGQLEDHPEYWKEWVKNASKQQIEAAKEGVRLAVDHQINAMRHTAGARKGEAIPTIEFNKEKLSLLFGKDEVNKMSKMLHDESEIAKTNAKMIEGSQTAMRTKADSRVDLPTAKGIGFHTALPVAAEVAGQFISGMPVAGLAGYYSLLGAQKALDKSRLKIAKSKNDRMTDLITATGEGREEVIKMLESHLPKQVPSLRERIRNFSLPVLPP